MNQKVEIFVYRVFTNKEGNFGNPVGIVLDEQQALTSQLRQFIASQVNFSETVFIENIDQGRSSIFNPIREVKFAGHALVGTNYFLNHLKNIKIETLICKGGLVKTWQENDLTWIQASLKGTPNWIHKQLSSSEEIENLNNPQRASFQHTMVWSWIDEKNGIIRARTFAPDWGILEDEANGSGSMQLAHNLQRNLEIHHGKGSIIYSQPINKDEIAVGGNIIKDISKVIQVII